MSGADSGPGRSAASVTALAVAAVALANLIGGATYLGQKLALEGLPPVTITLLRSLIAMACLGVMMRFQGARSQRWTAREHGQLALLGILASGLPMMLGIVGLRWSTAGNGSLLILLEPASILVFSWLLLGERIRRPQVLGVGLGLIGALFIVLEESPIEELFEGDHLKGNVILAMHGILWGLYSPIALPLVRKHPAVNVTFAAMAWGLLLLVPAALMFETHLWADGPELMPALGWTLALGVVASFVATVLWVYSLRHLAASTVAPFVFLQPFAGVLAGHLVLGEVLSQDAMLGGALIAGGVLLVLLPGWRRRAPARAG